MSELIVTSPPTKNTEGEIGDIVTVSSSGDKYELVRTYTVKTYHDTVTIYEWVQVYDPVDEGGGGSVVSPTIATQAIDGGTRIFIRDAGGSKHFDVMNGISVTNINITS